MLSNFVEKNKEFAKSQANHPESLRKGTTCATGSAVFTLYPVNYANNAMRHAPRQIVKSEK